MLLCARHWWTQGIGGLSSLAATHMCCLLPGISPGQSSTLCQFPSCWQAAE